ncbi:hypothetical protein B0H14DRAFT_3697277 [Mycena olivaceomarginata]|nr:hypothetical protein B0H14DRAFT_3697277 [Mycena olivaceomarginata]
MPRGRPRLDPDLKQQHLQDSRKRYEERNVERRREAAKLRMQRYDHALISPNSFHSEQSTSKRASVAASDYFTRLEYRNDAAASSARYRDRKRSQEREERHAANAVKKRARKREEEDIRRKHKPTTKPPPIPRAKPPLLPAKPPHRRWPSSPITPTPAPRRTAPPLNNGHLTAEDLNDSSTDEEPNEDRARCPLEAPTWPSRAAHPKRCPHCFEEDCIGCACMCDASPDWIEHGGHFFPTCKYCKGEDCSGCACPPYPGILLCTPIYQPDPGHEDRWKHPGPFYAVVSEEWRGVVTSITSLERMKLKYPDARTFQASPWSRFDKSWNMDCTEYHNHEGEHPKCPATPESSTPSSPLTVVPSLLPPLGSPQPTSPDRQRARLQSSHARPRMAAHDVEAAFQAGAQVISTKDGPIVVWPEFEVAGKLPHTPTAEHEVVEEIIDAHGSKPVMYAVSGHNRVFQNRNRAMAVLQRTPGAELLFTRDENQLFEFLAEEVVDFSIHFFRRSPTALHTAAFEMPKAPTLSAHAARNPTKPVQQPRQRHESQASKASRALAAEQRADNDLALTAKFNEIFLQREEDIKTLTRDFSKTENYIRQVLENRTHYAGKRAPSLKNAITHRLSKEARENGDTYNARDEEINLSGERYRAYKDSLTEEEKKSLLDDLAESRNVKEHGVRATNKAVALDAMQTSSQIGKVIIALHSRTAVRGFAMFTRGHPDDPAMPSFVESDEASKFFEDTFDCSVWDVVRKFELWSCNRDKTNNRNDIDAVRNQITVLVEDALRKITGNKTLTMSWANYKIDIVHTHGVEMAGWPSSVVLVRPSKMAADAARRILDKLRSGAIHWVALTRSQRAEVAEEVEALHESGAVKKRKQRSDKDKPRGPRAKKSKATDPNTSEDDSEEEPMPASAPRAPNAAMCVPRAPNAPASAPRTPSTPMSAPQAPNAPASASQAPNAPASAPRAPNAPTSAPRAPNAPTSAPRAPNAAISASRAPNAPASAPRAPNAPASAPRAPNTPNAPNAPASAACAPIAEVSAAAGQPQTSQAATSAALRSTSPATSLSNAATAFTGTLPASSATPASAALSAGTMPFGSQLTEEEDFNFDFVGMDFGSMPLFPFSTSTSQLGPSTDELTNDGVTMHINTSNREDFAFDGGFNGGSGVAGDPSPSFAYDPRVVLAKYEYDTPNGHYPRGSAPSAQVSGGTTGYIGATDNIFPGAFIPAVLRAAPTASGSGPGAFMSVFSVATNTLTQKRKRGGGGWGREASTQDPRQEELGKHRGRRRRRRHASPFEARPERSAAALDRARSRRPYVLTRCCQLIPMPHTYMHLNLL